MNKGIKPLAPDDDRLALINIKAAYISSNINITCLTAYRLDFTRIKTDIKKQKLMVKEMTTNTGNTIKQLNKELSYIKPTLDAYKMSKQLDERADKIISKIYDFLLMDDEEFNERIEQC